MNTGTIVDELLPIRFGDEFRGKQNYAKKNRFMELTSSPRVNSIFPPKPMEL